MNLKNILKRISKNRTDHVAVEVIHNRYRGETETSEYKLYFADQFLGVWHHCFDSFDNLVKFVNLHFPNAHCVKNQQQKH